MTTDAPSAHRRKQAGVESSANKAYTALNVPAQLVDLADLPHEIFLPSSQEKTPESFKKFIQATLPSDGLVVVTPEYNGSFPGVLKYFIDMLPFPESFPQGIRNGSAPYACSCHRCAGWAVRTARETHLRKRCKVVPLQTTNCRRLDPTLDQQQYEIKTH